MSDRPVSTDALETLGTIIDDRQKRDAIHLAVEPVIAGELLRPGERIVVVDGVAHLADVTIAQGIVDPFIDGLIPAGARFWFVMNPRQVTSLRHVWSHPAFPDEPGTTAPDKATSEQWLRIFCGGADCPRYETVMELIEQGVSDHGSIDVDYLHFNGRDAHGEIPPEFWVHAEIVLGRKLEHHPTHFSCSC